MIMIVLLLQGVIFPSWYIKDLYLWQELYCTSHLIPYSPTTPTQLPHKSEQITPSKNYSPINRICSPHNSKTDLEPSSSPTTIKSNNVSINSNNSPDVIAKNTGVTSTSSSVNGGGTQQDSDSLFHSSMFQSFAINENNHNGGNVLASIIPSYVTGTNLDMEDSFRVIDEAVESSLTLPNMKQLSSSLSDGDPGLTPVSINNQLSVGVASNSKLNLSMFSECESRLRNLSEDGMTIYQDPIQERVRVMEEQYQSRISQLEEKVKRVTIMLRHKMDSSNGERSYDDDEDILELISESSDNNNIDQVRPQ